MELKYYLRGLGLGIVVTAIIMGLALSGQKTMTDEEVIARAKTLGMVESTDNMLLSDTAEETGAEPAEETNAEPEVEISAEPEETEQTTEESVEQEPQENIVEEHNSKAEDAKEEDAAQADATDAEEEDVQEVSPVAEQTEEEAESAETQKEIAITIVSGDSSYSVAKKLADAGIVPTAEAYDAYLCANGYDKKLRTGTFSIPTTASDEQIAQIVTGRTAQ